MGIREETLLRLYLFSINIRARLKIIHQNFFKIKFWIRKHLLIRFVMNCKKWLFLTKLWLLWTLLSFCFNWKIVFYQAKLHPFTFSLTVLLRTVLWLFLIVRFTNVSWLWIVQSVNRTKKVNCQKGLTNTNDLKF